MSKQILGMDAALVDRYADLIIEKGINLKEKKGVLILTGSGTYYFARALAKSAYRHKAKYVQIMIDDLDVLASRLDNQDDEALTYNPALLWHSTISSSPRSGRTSGWTIPRTASTTPRSMDAKPNPEKAKRQFSEERSRRLMRHQLPWCVCIAPGPLWAKQVLGAGATTADLMETLKPILLLDQSDPSKAWDEKGERLKQRQHHLNDLGIDSLHFKSPVTDLTIGMNRTSRFVGGSEKLPDGRPFFANLPTEEIFSTPDWRRTEGYVTTTRPVSVLDTPTEGVRLVFTEGKVSDYSAQVGEEAMDRFFQVDEGTRSIGEVALVDETSPIAQSGLVFHSILLDENASCHIALGEGYPTALSNGGGLNTDEELRNGGCNTS